MLLYGTKRETKHRYGRGQWKRPKPLPPSIAFRAVEIDREAQEVGPFYVQGKKASDLEWRVYKALKRLGWTDGEIDFQTAVMGGRMPGGAMLDFVVWTPGLPVVIEPNGDIWHTATTATRERDKVREAKIRRAWNHDFRYVVLPQGEIVNDQMTYDRLLREVGKR